MVSFASGMMLGLSLIVAIGAQNIWVLSQSMAGANRLAIAIACIVCDAGLIILGVYAASEVKDLIPSIAPWLTFGGVLFLWFLAFNSAKRAWQGNSGLKTDKTKVLNWKVTAIQTLAISLLNPHVYLDTVVLLGSIGAVQPDPVHFAIGACISSILWFGSLTAFSPKLKVLLSSPKRWQIFDVTIAMVLCVMSYQLITMI